jgi:hypothetical protein
MAGLNRRFTLAAVVLPFLLVAMSGWARANSILVTTLDGEGEPVGSPLCSLVDAVTAHNSLAPVNGCAAGSGNDSIFFAVTGTITIDEALDITSGTLAIGGPGFGCSNPGSCGIVISGGGSTQIVVAEPLTTVFLEILTLTNGFAGTGTGGGGAVVADGTDLEIFDSLLVNNTSDGPGAGPRAGAILGLSGTIEITNSTIANNTAAHLGVGSAGGAIWAVSAMKITNTTISGNKADFGGGYFNAPGPSLKGTILSNNTNMNCDSTLPTDVGFNISDDGSCGFLLINHSLNGTNPTLGPLQNNGGPTETFALLGGSPAINRIPVASCTDQEAIPAPLFIDQRLFARPDPFDLTTCDSGAFEFGAERPIEVVPNSEKLQIARSTIANSDRVNLAFSFIDNGPGLTALCDFTTNAFSGVSVDLFEGTCASIPMAGLDLDLSPFVVHTVNHQSYGTLFQLQPNLALQQPNETVSTRIVQLPTPLGACGEWTLNIQVAGLNTSDAVIGLGGTNPFVLVVEDLEGNQGCFDITNAIVGSQIPPPTPHPIVRRGVRRGR